MSKLLSCTTRGGGFVEFHHVNRRAGSQQCRTTTAGWISSARQSARYTCNKLQQKLSVTQQLRYAASTSTAVPEPKTLGKLNCDSN